jgi:hemolysin activation/secretion protein
MKRASGFLAGGAILLCQTMIGPDFAQAQTSPAPPAIPNPPTREEVERAPVRTRVARAPRVSVEGGIERAPCALAGEEFRSIRLTVNSVAFEDLRGLAPDALAPAYAEYIGTEQPVAIICEIRDRAATILRNAGYVAAVEVPEQRIADGAIRFQVLMAKLVAVRVRGDAGRAERTLAGYLEQLTEQEVFNRYDAERYLLLAGDMPGYDVRLSLRSAGAGRGEVIGEVAVLRTPAEVDFNVQNFGSRDLGRFGGLLRGQFYGLTGLGDRTSLAFFSTADFDEQQTLQIGHDFRLGSEGLALSGQFTYAWADPDVDDSGFDVKARTLLATAEASYPFLRSQSASVYGAAGLDIINQRVNVNGDPLTRDRLRMAFLRVNMESADPASLLGQGGYSAAEPRWRVNGSLSLRRGLDIFGASEGCGPNLIRCNAASLTTPSRLEGDPTATVIRSEFFGEVRPTPKLTIAAGIRAQASDDPLLSFEEFSAGNYTVGRGYDPGSLLGDSGVGMQLEMRFGSILPTAANRASVQPYVFFDLAKVRNKDRLTSDANNSLASIGGGLRSIFKGATIDVAIAVPLERTGIQTRRPDPRLLVSLTTRLLPWSF